MPADALPTALLLTVPAALVMATLVAYGWHRPPKLWGPKRDFGQNALDLAVALSVPVTALAGALTLALQWTPLVAAAAQVLLLVALVWFLVRCSGRNRLQHAGVWPRGAYQLPRDLRYGVLGALAALPLVMATNAWLIVLGLLARQPAPTIGHEMLTQMQRSGGAELIALVFTAVVVAPLLEELVFRGLLQSALLKTLGWRRRWPAVVCASAAWAAIHGAVPWQVMPGLFVLGLILGAMVERTGSLRGAILAHALFNAANVALVLAGVG